MGSRSQFSPAAQQSDAPGTQLGFIAKRGCHLSEALKHSLELCLTTA
ncbi:hypothetical protein [Pseudomonas sp.]|nr:hypothetical protein [Pseudomonas sp.]MDP3817118.1 hypothetical protein [Pseudomonas sp.]